ncbi:hypothetical protein SYNPS1DRAFT_21559 [Syncephalis pseudoplumigaleata]|uniref:Uncharacterized protein n=1 Tax=Syncephalis pseudoplumigaleata TaxID=1712513 RepID=A0A4P9Z2X3_9FUNG|nr:hypothetical protein SYNPS1DRAFT_21559 [Syncephalis pseudoplumigaleata]|eukprot:RKP26735.1 hypothetical protein SYNPS1DRAFT_21559 [Syncephalis pseudoplumigaleata]
MPFDGGATHLGTEWTKNATRILGIPLHSLGELLLPDYIMEAADDQQLLRERLSGTYRQLLLNLLAGHLFAYNCWLAVKMLATHRRSVPGWLCLLPAALGMAAGIVAALSVFPVGLSCRRISWYVGFAMVMAIICNSAIVLQKAYLVLYRQRWVLFVGTLLLLPQLGFMYVAWMLSPVTVAADTGCVVNYAPFLPWFWFGSTAPINLLFMGIFSHVAYKQYRRYGSDAWRKLARDGIQTMCLVVLCNIVCACGMVLQLGGKFSEMFFLVDW